MAEHIADLAKLPVNHDLAIKRGVAPGHYLTFGYETYQFAERYISIWDFDLTAKKRKEQQAISAPNLPPSQGQMGKSGRHGLSSSTRLRLLQ